MRRDLVFICRKCNHELYLTNGLGLSGRTIVRKLNYDCPNCGEEKGELWTYSRTGNFEEENQK